MGGTSPHTVCGNLRRFGPRQNTLRWQSHYFHFCSLKPLLRIFHNKGTSQKPRFRRPLRRSVLRGRLRLPALGDVVVRGLLGGCTQRSLRIPQTLHPSQARPSTRWFTSDTMFYHLAYRCFRAFRAWFPHHVVGAVFAPVRRRPQRETMPASTLTTPSTSVTCCKC